MYAPNVALFCDDLFGLVLPESSVMCERDLDLAALLVHTAAVLQVQAPNLQVCGCLLLCTSRESWNLRRMSFLCFVCVSRWRLHRGNSVRCVKMDLLREQGRAPLNSTLPTRSLLGMSKSSAAVSLSVIVVLFMYLNVIRLYLGVCKSIFFPGCLRSSVSSSFTQKHTTLVFNGVVRTDCTDDRRNHAAHTVNTHLKYHGVH